MPEKIHVNGVSFELIPCGHCGRVPNEADALRAWKEWKEEWGPVACPICGELVGMPGFQVHHREDGSWRVQPGRVRRLTIRVEGITFGSSHPVHEQCLLNAMPHGGKAVIESAQHLWGKHRRSRTSAGESREATSE